MTDPRNPGPFPLREEGDESNPLPCREGAEGEYPRRGLLRRRAEAGGDGHEQGAHGPLNRRVRLLDGGDPRGGTINEAGGAALLERLTEGGEHRRAEEGAGGFHRVRGGLEPGGVPVVASGM